MKRIFGIELRRSGSFGSALILLLVGAGMLYVQTHRWAVGWLPLAVVQREYTLLLWPLALAAGTWLGRRDHRTKVGELFGSTPRPHAQRMLPLLGAAGIAVGSAYVAATAVAGVWLIRTASYLPTAFFAVVAVGALSLIAAAWTGLAIGRVLPTVWTGPLVAVASFAVLMVVGPFGTGNRDWLGMAFNPTYGMTLNSDYQTVIGRVSAAQAIWLAALAIAGGVLLLAGGWRTRLAALLPVVLGVAAAISVIPRAEESVLTPSDPVAQALVCAEGMPRVCVSRIHSSVLAEVTPPARQALALLAKLPEPPTAVLEDASGPDAMAPVTADVLLFHVRIDKNGRLAHRGTTLLEMVDTGIATSSCEEGANTSVERAVAFWLLGREPLPETQVVPEVTYESPEVTMAAVDLWQRLRRMPEQQALATAAQVRSATVACRDVTGMIK